MKWTPVLICLLLLTGSACCPPCEKGFLADFSLHQDSNDWFDFLGQQSTRLFQDQTGRQVVFTYEALESGVEDLQEDCSFDERCGACCYEYQAGYLYTELRSADGVFVVNLTLRKNFLTRSPLDEPATLDDYLSLTLNNQLTCELFDLPDRLLTRTLTLNGRTYSQVWYCEQTLPPDAPPQTPAACYFSRTLGIVGLVLADGTTWSLIP